MSETKYPACECCHTLGGGRPVILCPLHAATEELLEAAKAVQMAVVCHATKYRHDDPTQVLTSITEVESWAVTRLVAAATKARGEKAS